MSKNAKEYVPLMWDYYTTEQFVACRGIYLCCCYLMIYRPAVYPVTTATFCVMVIACGTMPTQLYARAPGYKKITCLAATQIDRIVVNFQMWQLQLCCN